MQVDTLSAQVAELSQQAQQIPLLQSALDTAKQEKAEAEQKLHVAVNENQQIQDQVIRMLGNASCACVHLAAQLAVHVLLTLAEDADVKLGLQSVHWFTS